MKRHSYISLILLLCLLHSIGAIAYDFKVDGIYYNIINESDKSVEVTSSNYSYGYSGAVNIPEYVTYENETYHVTRIGNYAFDGCSDMTEIAIPGSIVELGVCAFSECSGLITLDLPHSVTTIHHYAFRYCTGLTTVIVPHSVTSIGEEAFKGCTGLTHISLSENITTISAGTFEGCIGMTSFDIPLHVERIGEEAFKNCSGLTNIYIPECVKTIENYAFEGCSGITDVTISDSDSTLEVGYNSKNPNGEGLFYDCPITTLYVGRNLSYSNSYYTPFGGITQLQSVVVGDNVTSIDSKAFQN